MDHTEAPRAIAPAARARLGTRLRERRSTLRLSQAHMAERAGRHQSVVSRWETDGLGITPADLLVIAEAYEVDATDLLEHSALPHSTRVRSSRATDRVVRMRIGSRLAALRHERRMDPVDVWRGTRISPHRLARIEGGSDASLDELRRLLHVYDASLLVLGADGT